MRYNFFWSEVCFDALSHIPYAFFLVKIENKVHILLTLHVDYNKVFACYGLEILKNTPFKMFKQGGARPVPPALDPPWQCLVNANIKLKLQI